MHELSAGLLPLMGVPLFALQSWLAGRLPSRSAREKEVSIGDTLRLDGVFPEARGGRLDLGEAGAGTLVLVFMSNRCPGVMAYDQRLNELAQEFGDRGVRFVGVNSVAQDLHPREGLADMRRSAADRGLAFPYVKDAHQDLARALDATSTPQAFVVDQHGTLRYRGRIDDSFLPARVKARDLREALDAIVAGRDVTTPETPALGCHLDRIHAPEPAR